MDDDKLASPYSGLADKIRAGKSEAARDHDDRPGRAFVSRPRLNCLHYFLRSGTIVGLVNTCSEFAVWVDGERVAGLVSGAKVAIDLTPGDHTIFVKTALSRSRTLEFTIANGQELRFTCDIRWFGVLIRRFQ